MTSSPTVNLLDLDAQGLVAYCDSLGEKPFRAKQLQRWIHQYDAADFDGMTDLAKSLREKLKGRAAIEMPDIVSDHISTDGTRKWLIDVGNGNAVETVYHPRRNARHAVRVVAGRVCGQLPFLFDRQTGFLPQSQHRRDHRPVAHGRVRTARDARSGRRPCHGRRGKGERVVTNVVMMGMGEPLLNYDAVVPAMRLMLDDNAYGLSRRRVTLSTSGVVPMMDRLGADLPVALAVSLHAPNDPLRDMLVPLNKKYPLRELMAACQRYLKVAPRDFITFEYCMLDGVNDSEAHARELLAVTRDVPCKFNLIPFNPFPESGLRSLEAGTDQAVCTSVDGRGRRHHGAQDTRR